MTTLAHQHARQATLYALAAYAFFSCADTTLKYITHSFSYPPSLVLVLAGLFLCTHHLIHLVRKGQVQKLIDNPNIKHHLIRVAIVSCVAPLTGLSITLMPLPDFYSIVFLTPFMGVILAHFMLREEIGWHRLIAIIIGFSGVLILAQPQFETFNIGYLLTFIATILIGFHMIALRRLVGRESFIISTFYPGLGMMIGGGFLWVQDPVLPALQHLPYFLLYTGIFLAAQVCFITAYTRTPMTSLIAPLVYTQMLWAILFSYILFATLPTTHTLIGAGIVMAAGAGMMMMDARRARVHFARAPKTA